MKAKIYTLSVPYGEYVYAAESVEQLKPTVEKYEEVCGDVTVHENRHHVTADVPYTPYCLGGHIE
jgi:hypothetical protein